MATQNYFQKLDRNDYALFLKYYTKIRYSYFLNDDPNPNKEAITDFLTNHIETVNPRHISRSNYESFLQQASIYLYHDTSEDTDEIVGFLMFSELFSKKKIIIHEYFILENFQGKDLGRKMYNDFLVRLKDDGCFKVIIELMCSFEGAEVFWKKMGFGVCRKEKVGPIGGEKRYYSKTERLSKL